MIKIKEHKSLAEYTIYKIGGLARFFVEPENPQEVKEALGFAVGKDIPFVLLGAGSNVLVSDNGFDGLVIHMTGGMVSVDGERIKVDAGVMMARAVNESAIAILTGFEWGIGIPGSIGGSVRGNAGCFGAEMKDAVESVEVYDAKNNNIIIVSNKECAFRYRDSLFKTHPELVILSATLRLKKGNSDDIAKTIRRIMQERIAKQDIGAKCCGCIFKNVPWSDSEHERDVLCNKFPELAAFREYFAIPSAFLIDRAGLKGRIIGNICISEKHANFFINKGGGSSSDVLALIAITKKEVKNKFNIELSEEIHMIGF